MVTTEESGWMVGVRGAQGIMESGGFRRDERRGTACERGGVWKEFCSFVEER
jgi:hypothetical protein